MLGLFQYKFQKIYLVKINNYVGSYESNIYDNTYIRYKLKTYLVNYSDGNKIE
jgi:hypothetical protein